MRRGFGTLEGAHVLITGASRGLGLELARAGARRGARLTITARNHALLGRVATDLGAKAIAGDLSDATQLEELVSQAEDHHGPVDVLINNAGLNSPTALGEQGGASLRTQLSTNLLAPLELTRQALPGMRARNRGAIVNISSVAGDVAIRQQVPYCASKAGLSHATRALQRELRRTSVSAHLVVLGLVATDMIDELSRDPVAARIAKRFDLLPELSPSLVSERILTAVETGRGSLVLPGMAAPMHHLRLLPTYMTDGLLAGIH